MNRHIIYVSIRKCASAYYWYFANALCVRLGVLLVCSMWKCRMQVLQRTMTSQTMCWCLAYSPLAVHSISKSAGTGRFNTPPLFCGWQMPRQSQKLPWPQWICAGFLLALKEERYSTMELRSKSHIVCGPLRRLSGPQKSAVYDPSILTVNGIVAWGHVLTTHEAFNIKAHFGWVSHAQRWAAWLQQWWMPFVLTNVRLSKKETEDCLDRCVSDGIDLSRCLQKALFTLKMGPLALRVGIGLTEQGTKMSFLSGQEQNWGQGLSVFFRMKMQESWSKLKWLLHLGADSRALMTYKQKILFQGRVWCYDDDPQDQTKFRHLWTMIQRLKVRATCGAHCQPQWLQGD